jgi:hypothetical protein
MNIVVLFFAIFPPVVYNLTVAWRRETSMKEKGAFEKIYGFLMQSKQIGINEPPRQVFLEIAVDIIILVFITLSFTNSISNFNANFVPSGSEWDTFAVPDMVLRNSISQFHTIPMWNPFINTGIPFFADPMAHFLNLQAFAPIMLFGEINGLKIALIISFFIAGLGQCFLCYYLGIGRLARLWSAVIFMMNGQLVARFFQGQYNLVLSAVWLPFFILSAFAVFKSRRKWPIVLGAFSIAQMWLAGSPYYVIFIIGVLLCITMFYVLQKNDAGTYVFNKTGILRVIVMGVLGLMLTTVTLLPQLEVAPRLVKVASGMEGFQPFHRAVINYLADDTKFANINVLGKLPVDEEYYAYIGIAPFIFLMFLVLAFKPGHRREILAIISILILMALWVDVGESPLRWLFETFPFMNNNLHYPSRALIVGASLFAVLGAFGLDALILWIVNYAKKIHLGVSVVIQPEDRKDAAVVEPMPLLFLFFFPVIAYVIMSIFTIYKANNQFVVLKLEDPLKGQILDQIKPIDLSTYYLSARYSSGWHQPIISRGFHWVDAWYGWVMISSDPTGWTRKIPDFKVKAKYELIDSAKSPEVPDAVLLKTLPGNVNFFRLQNSPPFAFLYPDVPDEASATGWIEAPATWMNPNEVVVKFNAIQPGDLVVLAGSYPGWSVKVDGSPAVLEDINGFLGVRALNGDHTYRFNFISSSFIAGLLISLLGLLLIIVYSFYKKPTILEAP